MRWSKRSAAAGLWRAIRSQMRSMSALARGEMQYFMGFGFDFARGARAAFERLGRHPASLALQYCVPPRPACRPAHPTRNRRTAPADPRYGWRRQSRPPALRIGPTSPARQFVFARPRSTTSAWLILRLVGVLKDETIFAWTWTTCPGACGAPVARPEYSFH